MSDPILDAIEASNTAFAEFKARNEAQLAEQRQTIERLEAKAFGRPGNGGLETAGSARTTRSGVVYDSPECKAWSIYMRSGAEAQIKSMDVTNPSEGGYALPKQISAQISSIMLRYSPLRKLVTIEQAFTQDYHHVISDPRTTGSGWVGEMAARPATATPTLIDAAPPMGEIYANPQITQTALDDVFFNAEQYLVDNVTQTFLAAEGVAFWSGTGVNQPKGLLTYPTSAVGDDTRAQGTIQYTPTGAAAGFLASSATVSPFDVLQAALFSMKPQYRLDCAWVCNSATLAVLASIKDGQGRYVLQPTQVAGMPPTILGVNVYEDPNMPAIGASTFPIALISRQAYLVVDRMPIRSIRDPFSNKPYIGMYTTKRVGGGALVTEAIKFIKVSVS